MAERWSSYTERCYPFRWIIATCQQSCQSVLDAKWGRFNLGEPSGSLGLLGCDSAQQVLARHQTATASAVPKRVGIIG